MDKPIKVNISPLSVNRAFQGRRFKTKEYKEYETASLLLLPKIKNFPEPPYKVEYTFGFSSKLSDLGNPEKLVSDILCKKYKFNDRDIWEMTLKKKLVPKGKEFFEFRIYHLSD